MRLVFGILVLFAALAAQAEPSCKHDSKTFRCVKYVRNYDADTITFNIPDVHPLFGKNINVRVKGVDTPEIKGSLPCEKDQARTARRLVENMVKRAHRIDLMNVDRDKYFRILAYVIIDGQNLKDYLIKNQLAYIYDGGTKQKINWCERQPAKQ
jgi:endonuclease YncB( thermonuclease family)